tara:strand:+ start:1916 stop:2623 length:708 start_codon:yes stop_codon:yes gene_type:complete
MTNLNKTMDAVAELHKSHGVRQKGGKLYTQVVHRMEAFRKQHGTEFGVDTSILVNDGQKVVVKAIITDKDSRIVGAGMAEEIRGQGLVNTTSALENAETSAIGRALASLGLAGGEYASANEMDAVVRKTDAIKETPQKEVKNEVVEQTPVDNTPPSQPNAQINPLDAVQRYEQMITRIKQARFTENREAGQLRLLQDRFQRDYESEIMKLPKEIQQKILKLFTDAENQLKSQIRR